MITWRLRLILVAVGVLLVAISLTALIFAWSPVEVLGDRAPIAPTLFSLPPGGNP
jgi:hypothetical protein